MIVLLFLRNCLCFYLFVANSPSLEEWLKAEVVFMERGYFI